MHLLRPLLASIILYGLSCTLVSAQGDGRYPGRILPAQGPSANYSYQNPNYQQQNQGYAAQGYNPAMMPPPQMMPMAVPSGAVPTMPNPAMVAPGGTLNVGQWFSSYDQIRHAAQMSPSERQHADSLMSRGLSILMPGEEKQSTKALLSSLVVRYQRACQQLNALPRLPQTQQLHQGYFNYFANASQLFNDYVRVQDNLFLTDVQTGKPLAAGLLQRKQMLESLEHQVKALDAQTRGQLGMPAYPY